MDQGELYYYSVSLLASTSCTLHAVVYPMVATRPKAGNCETPVSGLGGIFDFKRVLEVSGHVDPVLVWCVFRKKIIARSNDMLRAFSRF